MADAFATSTVGLESPAIGAFVITKSDSELFVQPTRALWVGGGGNVAVQMVSGEQVTLSSVITGTLLPVRVNKVLSTGTTATSIIGFY
jgi:hypothetical protein